MKRDHKKETTAPKPRFRGGDFGRRLSEGGTIRLETLIELKSQFELFELILLSKLGRQFPVGQFEAMVSQSTVNSPPLNLLTDRMAACFVTQHIVPS